MILTLDVGNSHIYGGVFDGDKLRMTFRKKTAHGSSSDEMGLFLRAVLRENALDPAQIKRVAVCSVVPDLVHSLRNCCLKYFKGAPFILQAGVKTGLKIKYRNPLEVGSDRIATAIAATHLYPNKNLIVIDFGTATTFCAITADKDYLGGVIVAGLRISMEALESKTARLPSVEIVVPEAIIGRSTIESIQAGLYYGNIGMVKEITSRITAEAFSTDKPIIIGTGGFASLLDRAGVFDVELPDLVLKGIFMAAQMNA